MLPITIGFYLVFLLVLFQANVFWDEYLIKKQVNIPHAEHALVVAAIIFLMNSIFAAKMYIPAGYLWAGTITIPSLRWLYHDFALNFIRDKSWNYVDTDPPRAVSDAILTWGMEHLGPRLGYITVKLLLILASFAVGFITLRYGFPELFF